MINIENMSAFNGGKNGGSASHHSTSVATSNTIRFYSENGVIDVVPNSGKWTLDDFINHLGSLLNYKADENTFLHYEYHYPDFDGVIRLEKETTAYYSIWAYNFKTGKRTPTLADIPAVLFSEMYNNSNNHSMWF